MQIINIDDIIGVRYKFEGRTPKDGFDCYGLLLEVEKRFGHKLPDLDSVHDRNYNFEKSLFECEDKVKVELTDNAEEAGDIIIMNDEDGIFNHCGVYLGNGQVIHCDLHGVHIDRIGNLKSRIGRVYRWL